MRLSTMGYCRILLVALVCALFPVSPVAAQTTTGTISGTVTDESGSVVPGTTVTVTHVATGATRTAESDEMGRYFVPGLSVGAYEVKAERAGFQTHVQAGVELTIGRQAVVDIPLKVGALTDQVVVTADAPLVDTTAATLAGLVDEQVMRDLPLNGRSFVQLTTLEAGVQEFKSVGEPATTFPGSGRGIRIAFNGARPEFNNYLIDGIDAGDAFNSSPGSAAGVFLGVETLREFQVLTNAYSAEFGRVGGGIVNAVSRSGENNLHGTIFEFHRNDNLDARNFFDELGGPPEFKRNQFGGVISGPIKQDQTFFLFSYEGLRERKGITKISFVPTLAQKNNANNHPAGQPYLNLYPDPNIDVGNDGDPSNDNQHRSVFTRPTDEDFFTGRIDHRFSDSDSLFVRYTFDDGEVLRPLSFAQFGVSDDSQNQYLTVEENKVFSPSLLNTFRFGFNSSEFDVNDIELQSIDPALSFIPGQDFGILGVGGLSPLGLTTFGPTTATEQKLFVFSDTVSWTRGAHSVKFGANIRIFQIDDDNSLVDNGIWQFFSVANLQGDAAAGRAPDPFAWLSLVPGVDRTRELRQQMYGFFVQDDWKVTPTFTLNLGLRYEFITVPTESGGELAVARNPLTDTLADVVIGGPVIDNPSLSNIAPRVGFAWDPFGDGKTAIRGGGGIYHNQLGYSFFFRSFLYTPPLGGAFAFPGFLPFMTFPQPALPPIPGNILFPTQFDIDQPTIYQYNLSVQREILPSMVVTVSYVGTRGTNLGRPTELNTFAPTTINGETSFPVPHNPATMIPPPARVNPAWVSINQIDTGGSSSYNSFQVNLSQRVRNGLQFQVAYTYGHSIDDSPPMLRDVESAGSIVIDALDRRRDRGNSNFDVRQNLTVSYTYDLPLGQDADGTAAKFLQGWQLGGIIAAKTGTPFTVDNAFDRASSGKIGPFLTDRPDLVGDPFQAGPVPSNTTLVILIRDSMGNVIGQRDCTQTISQGGLAADEVRTPQTWFNPCAFAPQPLVDATGSPIDPAAEIGCFFTALQCFGRYGTAGRNILDGPDLINVDFSLVKTTPLSEKANLEFRLELFNLFNHTNFSVPTGPGRQATVGLFPAPGAIAAGNPAAGRITKTVTDGRQIQFGIKINF